MSFSVRSGDPPTDLNARLAQVTDVARALPRFESHHDALRADGAESINHDLALDGLNWIDDDGHRTGVELFKGLEYDATVSSARLSHPDPGRGEPVEC